ncbi:PREDICTED: large proline-rich protein bag6-B-like isoform X2 [Camelina sativa]|uniref:Large proline-rich protein bag6-B-like isoform X2 n=1 Tax=Camelina sativa TaxID=90675 RepID=A0ABM0Y0V2_CAMSA|nr:PREDICTED: large proline-rich protein bag6-B-like isoform X2 [Camelina sativa]
MGHNGKDEIMVEASQCAGAMVEIKIKTLDSQTYTLRVDKCVPVPALKEQVASITGVVTEQQRLICRGKVMKDDQLLSAYHVEDGHTLHLVVRQPVPPLSESSTSNAAADPALSAGDSQGSQQRSRVVVGSFNIAEQADGGVYSDLGQIVSAVLGSLGISNPEGGIEGIDSMGPLHERLSRSSGPSSTRDSSGGRSAAPNAADQTSTPLTSSQVPTFPLQAIPDSLTTLSEYLNHLRHEFAANGSNANNLQDSENSMGNVQDSASTTGESRIPRPSHLAEVLQSTRQLLIGEVADCLSNLSTQLVDHVNVTDPSTRRLCQSNMNDSGSLLENLGISLLELGRATMMLRLGQTPDDAVVNAGPAVFISPTRRNPLTSTRQGTSIGGLQAGSAHSNPFAGQSLASTPRNIEIRIRTGSWVPTSGTNQREESTTQQTPGQSVPPAPSSTTDSAPSTRGPSEPRNPVALVIPVVARYQQVSLGERSFTGLDGVHQSVTESSRQPQSAGTPGREGGSGSPPGGRRLAELRDRINQFLRPSSRREHQAGSSESQVAANPSSTAATEPSEAVANAQAEPLTTTDEGNFISSVLQQIMPFISQNVASSSSGEAVTGRGSNNSRQASSREEEEGAERGDSSRRRGAPSPPESKRQRRE